MAEIYIALAGTDFTQKITIWVLSIDKEIE